MNSIISILLVFNLFISCNEEEPELPLLQTNVNSVHFLAEGGDKSISLKSNTSWTLTYSSDWCTASVQSGEGDADITLSSIANEDRSIRSVTLSIEAEDLTQKVVVIQSGIGITEIAPDISFDKPPDNTEIRNLTAIELSQQMGVGWNIGNSLDATEGETSWGNPKINQQLIDSVKAAGFNAIRIPVAWSKFADEASFTIESGFMERVEEVVNYVLSNNMYAIVNIHWDGGWMQPTNADEAYVNNRLAIMWKQIAGHFRDYNDYLLFAGTNEVMVEGDYGTPTPEYYTVQNGFNQTFVTTVRSTGGRNANRHLVIQGFNTNIGHTVSFAEIPKDLVKDRLFMEVHYYDPYNFALNENSNISQWGNIATNPSLTETWANESWVDSQFHKMKTNFVDKGIAVIIGEYGAISRLDVEGHEEFRRYYTEYLSQSMIDNFCVPFYWDNGYAGNHGFALFNRATGANLYPEIVEAITSAVE